MICVRCPWVTIILGEDEVADVSFFTYEFHWFSCGEHCQYIVIDYLIVLVNSIVNSILSVGLHGQRALKTNIASTFRRLKYFRLAFPLTIFAKNKVEIVRKIRIISIVFLYLGTDGEGCRWAHPTRNQPCIWWIVSKWGVDGGESRWGSCCTAFEC